MKKHIHLILPAILIIVGLFAYTNSLFNGFVWDDEAQIIHNALIQNLGNIPYIFSGATFTTGGAGLSGWFFRPFLTFTFMLNWLFWGESAFGYHFFQVAFHVLNGILIYKILGKSFVLSTGHNRLHEKAVSF